MSRFVSATSVVYLALARFLCSCLFLVFTLCYCTCYSLYLIFSYFLSSSDTLLFIICTPRPSTSLTPSNKSTFLEPSILPAYKEFLVWCAPENSWLYSQRPSHWHLYLSWWIQCTPRNYLFNNSFNIIYPCTRKFFKGTLPSAFDTSIFMHLGRAVA